MSATTQILLSLRTAGLSQSEISRRTGIPQPRISRWERGEAPTGADDALKLLELSKLILGASDAATPSVAPDDEEKAA